MSSRSQCSKKKKRVVAVIICFFLRHWENPFGRLDMLFGILAFTLEYIILAWFNANDVQPVVQPVVQDNISEVDQAISLGNICLLDGS